MPGENCLPVLFYIICGYIAEHSFTLIISSNALWLYVLVENYQVKFHLSEDNQLKFIP